MKGLIRWVMQFTRIQTLNCEGTYYKSRTHLRARLISANYAFKTGCTLAQLHEIFCKVISLAYFLYALFGTILILPSNINFGVTAKIGGELNLMAGYTFTILWYYCFHTIIINHLKQSSVNITQCIVLTFSSFELECPLFRSFQCHIIINN